MSYKLSRKSFHVDERIKCKSYELTKDYFMKILTFNLGICKCGLSNLMLMFIKMDHNKFINECC